MIGAAAELLRHSATPLSHPAIFRPARREIGKSQVVLLHLTSHFSPENYLWNGDSIEDPNDNTQLTEWEGLAKYIVSQSVVSVAGYQYFIGLLRFRLKYCTANITWTPARVLRYMYQNIPTLPRIQRLYYSFTLPSFENCIYSHQSIASLLACVFMYAYPSSHIVIGIIAYGSPVGLDLDIRALSSKQRLASETLE